MNNNKEISEYTDAKAQNNEINLQTDTTLTKKWSSKEDLLLIKLIKSSSKPIIWKQIAENFNKTTKQCYARYKKINPKFNKGKWSSDEENQLQKLVDKYGKKWSVITKFLKTRSNKQIRDHYNNCMDKSVNKNIFSEEELNKIKSLYMIRSLYNLILDTWP